MYAIKNILWKCPNLIRTYYNFNIFFPKSFGKNKKKTQWEKNATLTEIKQQSF